MTNIGTPDYQRGVVSAQALLATVAAGVSFVEVGVPPNAESIIVVARGTAAGALTSCYGVESSTTYPGAPLLAGRGVSSSPAWVYDVSAAIDGQATISFAVAPTLQWYVYSDAGVHITADLSKLTNSQGIPYYIPSAPSTAGGDHPPNEISHIGTFVAASGAITGGAGAGQRYRVYTATMSTVTAGVVAQITDFTSGATLLTLAGPGNSQLPYVPQGIPLSNGASLGYQLLAGAGSVLLVVYYTIETI